MTCSQKQNGCCGRLRLLGAAVCIYLVSGTVVVLGVLFANAKLVRQPHETQNGPGFINSFTSWDGMWYVRIVNEGYSLSRETYSAAAFFPAYPALGRCVALATGLRAEVALLCVSHTCLIAAIALLTSYLSSRPDQACFAPADGVSPACRLAPSAKLQWTLLAFAFFPPSLFFRMAYSESLFLLCLVGAMYAMERDWPVLAVAVIIGLATGTRLVGVALLGPLAMYAWRRYRDGRTHVVEFCAVPFVGCWGIVAFMAFLQHRFGDPLAFMAAQAAWNRRPNATLADYAAGLVSLEPLWSVFDPSSPAHWEHYASPPSLVFNVQVLNVVCFVLVAMLIVLGAWRGILNQSETVLAVLLLGIPYCTHSYQTLMWSEARFASVVFPGYLVLGDMASRAPAWLAAGLLGISAFSLGAYTALFASWQLVF